MAEPPLGPLIFTAFYAASSATTLRILRIRAFIDFIDGAAVLNNGYSHPKIEPSIREQLDRCFGRGSRPGAC